ncbi:hypothetical protein GYMLUDRAFT_173403 [Collybiopsis luxurians FD-317 M1]|uniref:Zn(2)-C6 fungal-type domain-containing protein n=1 Tax=Collybiopsis luxurians FD-317 M1 TaxID=944289 RepID=A0A0D0B1R0_9AGAR|nr:hypothetical protein GYMLUDRAFT_173403 [Collybiopsis luxurians FD-317 M1]
MSGPLASGAACVRCRERKMKCSGTKPICVQCRRANVADDCEYVARSQRSRISILQEDLDRLHARLRELEGGSSSEVHLHQPYSSAPVQGDNSLEPSTETKRRLLDIFLESAHEIGFTLNPARFRSSALLPYPLGHYARPTKALMSIVYVWGIHLSQDPSLKQLQENHLTLASRELASSLSGSHPNKIIYSIQAEILLARYLFSTGKVLEARYHLSRAMSLGIGSGLNKIRSNQTPTRMSSALGVSYLPPPIDSIEEGDRIMTCWTGFTLDKLWAAALDTSSDMICPAQIPGAQTDTPWPQEPEVYEQGGNFASGGYSFTTVNFITDTVTSDRGDSTQAILAKAAFCWERAADLAKDDPRTIGRCPS